MVAVGSISSVSGALASFPGTGSALIVLSSLLSSFLCQTSYFVPQDNQDMASAPDKLIIQSGFSPQTTGPGAPVATYITVPKVSLAAGEQGGVVCILEGGGGLCRKALGLFESGKVLLRIVNSSVWLW